jgi:spermidine/putrescine transport system substrate-binding protein
MTERNDDLFQDPSFVRGMTQRRLSRRDVFKYAGIGVGALSMSSILAACGGNSSSSVSAATGGGSTGADLFSGAPHKIVNFANWPYYIDKAKDANGQIIHPSLEQFTKDTGIQVNYREVIQDNASFFGKIQPSLASGQSTGWDIIVITNGTTLTKLFQSNYLVPLPTDMRPNFDAQASDAVKDPSYDPGNKFTMAWQSGLTGIGWDPNQVKALRPDKPTITSIHDLFDPAFKGKVGMFGDNQDLPNFTLLALGVNPEDSTPDDWQKAADMLTAQKPNVRSYYTQNYINALNNGDVALTMAWSGDIFQSNLSGAASGLQFTVPTEGAIIWTDNMCIPIGVQNPVDAITMMDYVYKPDIQALIEDYNGYICPVPASQAIMQKTDPETAKSPLVFPTPDEVAVFHTYRVLTDDELLTWNSLFEPIYQG